MKTIQLSHGGGGAEMNELLNSLFFKYFSNDILLKSEDAALLEVKNKIVFTTDSYTVSPIVFNGGNIGTIAVAGTLNDIAMMGARPLYLSAGFMIEEGLEYETLELIVKSMAEELAHTEAKIVCGDTKVVPKGAVDKIFINTSGIGEIEYEGISAHNISDGDTIIVSNEVGKHGATIFAHREGLETSQNLKSDCAVLYPAIKALTTSGIKIKAIRDATRGGLSAVLNEWADMSNVCLEIEEGQIALSDEVRGLCELFGFDPFDLANEGTFVLAVDSDDATKALDILRQNTLTQKASIIGVASSKKLGKVILKNPWGSSRYLELPKGELLPRIC